MYGLNIDPRNPLGNPTAAELKALGVKFVRFTFKDPSPGNWPDPDVVRFYQKVADDLAGAGIASLVILTGESCPQVPPPSAAAEIWNNYIDRFAGRAAEIATLLATSLPAFQIWQAPDQTSIEAGNGPGLPAKLYGQLLQQTATAIKNVNGGLKVITAGLVSGQPDYLIAVSQSLADDLPVDAVAVRAFDKRPQADWPAPDWGSGSLADLLTAYQQATSLPLWVTEIGVDTLEPADQAAFLRHCFQTMTNQFSDRVQRIFWFCYGDGMAHSFGLVTTSGQPKPAYQAYRGLATGDQIQIAAVVQTAVSQDSLYNYARYMEQSIVFGTRNEALQRQMESDLRWKSQPLSKVDIWRISQHLLTGSSHALNQAEIDGLYALQQGKDLYGVLRSIVTAVHQRTGALSGRIGVHTRIAAESDSNAATNVEAVMKVLSHVQPGNRMSVMDLVKANADEGKLRAPDVFETDVYGQHRNGLVDNHAWNLQRFVRAIRNRGYQDRIILIIRLDGPDDGANVNPFNPISLTRYELAIGKLIRYLEAMLPTVPFKIALGNEPDLHKERQWSDPNAEPRSFIINQFAPATGSFMKKIARLRPDMTFICPALSANMKHDYLAYYTAFFGNDRPENLVPAMHGYSADVASLPTGQRNLLEQQAEALRQWAGFKHISGTEIGSGNPFGDVETLSEKGRFDDVVAWLLLSVRHQTPLGQDNHWNFRVDPFTDDQTAQHLGNVVNRSQNRVLRNIRERSGGGLQILQGHAPDRPAYGVEYVAHNTPATMIAGQTNAVQITLRNTSYQTWPAEGSHPVRLGYHWYRTNGSEVPASLWADNRTGLPYNVVPGDTVTLQCNLSAPRTPDRYQVRWDVVEELRTWFAWQGVATLNVEVNAVAEQAPIPPEPGQLKVSSSHNNRPTGEDNLLFAVDNNPYTRWSSRALQTPGMWFQIDLGEVQTVSQLQLNTERSPRDYPRGYVVRVSANGQNWSQVAENRLNDQAVNVTFNPVQARYVRIEQTGSDPLYWWSIHEVVVSHQVKPTARASHNNVLSGADNVAQALDGNPATRWSTRALQRPGMWFELDLNQVREVEGLRFDPGTSSQDYPRGYAVYVATNRDNWRLVKRNDQNSGPLDVTWNAQPTRLIYVEQTGRSDSKWWSIHGITVKYREADGGEDNGGQEVPQPEQPQPEQPEPTPETPTTPSPGKPLNISVRSSHYNVTSGVDNILQAIDGNPATRWSSQIVQQPGMWFEVDLNQVRSVSGLRLDTAASPNDYPRGYVVRISSDRSQWLEVAGNGNNDRALDVSFAAQPARYIRIEQTGSSDRWWWSIHGITIKG